VLSRILKYRVIANKFFNILLSNVVWYDQDIDYWNKVKPFWLYFNTCTVDFQAIDLLLLLLLLLLVLLLKIQYFVNIT
jgi:hypothetical protein